MPKKPIVFSTANIKTNRPVTMRLNPNPTRKFTWGNKSNPNFANYAETDIGTTSSVGCFSKSASVYGCEEMIGNVW